MATRHTLCVIRRGQRMQTEVGRMLRKAYVDTGFLSPVFKSDEV